MSCRYAAQCNEEEIGSLVGVAGGCHLFDRPGQADPTRGRTHQIQYGWWKPVGSQCYMRHVSALA